METSVIEEPHCPGCNIQHRPEDCPVMTLLPAARRFIEGQEWIFAKTMADNPHHYVVWFHQHGADRDGYRALRELITRHGWKRRWGGSTWRTFSLDGYDYWHIHPVINRKPTEAAGWEDEHQERLF